MNKNELRIGNIVNYQISTSVFQGEVMAITKNRVVVDKLTLKFMTIEPIPLTEEWLIKLGFEKLREYDDGENIIIQYGKSIIVGNDEHDEKLVISFPFKHCEIGDYQDGYSYVLDITIDYVHQLQNLYFSLTGDELTIQNDVN